MRERIRIRPAPVRLYPALVAMDRSLFGEATTSIEKHRLIVATSGADIVAYAAWRRVDGDVSAYLSRAWVSPHYRGRGLQRRMIAWRVREAAAAGCEAALSYVVPSNSASLNNLIACGFRAYSPANPWVEGEVVYLKKRLQ